MSRKNNLIYCNRCGNIICPCEKQNETSFLTIEKRWGYFSDGKDGEIHSMNLCEPCYGEIVRDFVLAPKIRPVTEYL